MSDEPASLTRLRAFRQSLNEGDVIDERSGLTAADLDAAIDALTKMKGMVSIRSIDFSQAKDMDAFFRD